MTCLPSIILSMALLIFFGKMLPFLLFPPYLTSSLSLSPLSLFIWHCLSLSLLLHFYPFHHHSHMFELAYRSKQLHLGWTLPHTNTHKYTHAQPHTQTACIHAHTYTWRERDWQLTGSWEKREREDPRERVCAFLRERERKRGERECLSINWAKITDKYRGHPF